MTPNGSTRVTAPISSLSCPQSRRITVSPTETRTASDEIRFTMTSRSDAMSPISMIGAPAGKTVSLSWNTCRMRPSMGDRSGISGRLLFATVDPRSSCPTRMACAFASSASRIAMDASDVARLARLARHALSARSSVALLAMPLSNSARERSTSEFANSSFASAASRLARASCTAAEAASTAATACSRVRLSRTAGLVGSIRATTVSPLVTPSPGCTRTRSSLPATGVDTI